MKNGADKVFIQFSDDTDLYFHTQAADLISDQEQHTARMREEFAGEILRAIITGALDAYKHRDGTLRIYEPSWTGPFCVRPQDVNDWLARKTQYQFRWNSVIHQEAAVSKAVPKADQTPALQTASLVEVVHPLSKDSRRRDLQPLIDDAQGRCEDLWDVAEVWAMLSMFAEKKRGQLIGATEEGLQYLKNGEVAIFTRNALQKRLKRAREKLNSAADKRR